MIVRNIYKEQKAPLELFTDNRGIITDIFYKEDIHHVAQIDSKPNVIRGNHYHKEDDHYSYLASGKIQYYYRAAGSKDEPSIEIIEPGQMFYSPPMVEHTMKFLEDSTFYVFAKRNRDQESYEADVVRIHLA